ncbi:hypothetical protein MTO96_020013 [Rhipicephalus appendiculatus]
MLAERMLRSSADDQVTVSVIKVRLIGDCVAEHCRVDTLTKRRNGVVTTANAHTHLRRGDVSPAGAFVEQGPRR